MSRLKAIRINPQLVELIEMDNTLAAFQMEVDGYIEVVNLTENLALICNEEGKLMQQPFNNEATKVLNLYCKGLEYIVGTALVVGTQGDEFIDVTDEQISEIKNLF